MKIKGIVDEDFTNYKDPAMFVAFPVCNFKCCIEAGNDICQNMDLVKQPCIEVEAKDIVERYISNPISKSLVCGGLEPLDSFEDLLELVRCFRNDYKQKDPIVIYTGYNPEEVISKVYDLLKFDDIIVKFGRFMPNTKKRFDQVLGIELYEPQFAVELSNLLSNNC